MILFRSALSWLTSCQLVLLIADKGVLSLQVKLCLFLFCQLCFVYIEAPLIEAWASRTTTPSWRLNSHIPNVPLYPWQCFLFQRMLIAFAVVVLAGYQPVYFQISNLGFHSTALSLSAFAKLPSRMSLRLVCVHLQNKNHLDLGSLLS